MKQDLSANSGTSGASGAPDQQTQPVKPPKSAKNLYEPYITPPILSGAIRWLAIFVFHLASSAVSLQLYALLLAYTACFYSGAALSDGRPLWLSTEVGVSALVLACAFLGLWQSSRWLVAGYCLHGIWDMGHHPGRIQTRVVYWFPPICATFDFVVAIFIAVRY